MSLSNLKMLKESILNISEADLTGTQITSIDRTVIKNLSNYYQKNLDKIKALKSKLQSAQNTPEYKIYGSLEKTNSYKQEIINEIAFLQEKLNEIATEMLSFFPELKFLSPLFKKNKDNILNIHRVKPNGGSHIIRTYCFDIHNPLPDRYAQDYTVKLTEEQNKSLFKFLKYAKRDAN